MAPVEKIRHLTHKTFTSLTIRNYRLYFFGQAVSQTGTWMQTLSQSWLILKLTNSGTQLGLISAAQFLPILLFGPAAGIISDRYSKHKIILVTQSLFALLALALGLLVLFNLIKIWMLYIFASSLGLLTALDTPTRQSFVYEMVGEEKLTNAISLNGTLFNFTRIIGPAIAAALIASFGLAICFLLNAASYIAVIVALFLMDASLLHKFARLENIKGQIAEGFKYVNKNPILKDVLLYMVILGIFVYEFQVSIPLLAKMTFKGDATTYAILTSAMGLGSVFGGLYSASRKKPTMNAILFGIGLLTLGMFLTALSKNFYFSLLSIALIGFASTSYTSKSNVMLQLNSTPEMRGRVLALWQMAFVGTTFIGGPIIGYTSQTLNPRYGFLLGGFFAALVLAYGYFRQKALNKSAAP